MKSGWAIKKLGEVCELINGKNQSEVANPSGKYPIYGSGGVMGRADDFRCPAGCTIIGRKGSINNPLYVTEPFWNVDTAYALSPTGVESKFFYYFCLSFDFSKLDCGTTIPSLTSAIVKDVDIPIPPLAEQKRIVAKIDAAFEKIDKLKANAERNLANAKELFQSALDEAMRPKKGWVEKRLGEVCEILDSKRKPITKKDRVAGPIPYYGATSVQDHVRDYIFDEPLVLLGEDGAKWGAGDKSAYMIEGKSWVNNHAHVLRPMPSLLRPWLTYYLVASDLSEFISGTTVPKLNQERMRLIPIPMPPVSEQQLVVKQLDFLAEKIKLLDSHYTRQIADCAEMRQAVLREAFEGRL